jgi:hypothetical protein
MNCHDKISKDPRITLPLAELLKKIQETLNPPQEPTNHSPFSNTQDSPSSKTQGKP